MRQREKSDKQRPALAIAGLFLMLVVVAFVSLPLEAPDNFSDVEPGRPASQQEETETPFPLPTYDPHPILSATDAVTLSLEMLPDGFPPSNTVARLISASTLTQWRSAESPFIPASSPVWLVGITAPGMTIGDALPEFYGSGAAVPHATAGSSTAYAAGTISTISVMVLQGMYFAWDASSGDNIGYGALGPPWPQTFESIEALPDEQILIVAATEVIMDGPTEEWAAWPTP